MNHDSGTRVSEQFPRKSITTKRLIQAAALASALVPLGAVTAGAATINCVTSVADSIGCNGVSGDYTAGSGEQSNIWKFFTGYSGDPNNPETLTFDDLLYSFEIRGTPDENFELDVTDEVVGVFSEDYVIDFPNSQCTPLLEDDTSCVIFRVFVGFEQEATWDDTYYIEIRWFADGEPGASLSKPLDDGQNHIFRAESQNFFDDVLETELYDPELEADPEDPALGGRGSNFSSFMAGRADVSVPEPATLLLLGTGFATALYRRRKIK